MRNFGILSLLYILMTCGIVAGQKLPVDYVDVFIGTTNYATTNPGAVCPNGLMSVVPFNVTGSKTNRFDKDNRWWSTPYENRNSYFTGFSHVNLSGVGCPELGSLLLMPTTGELNVDLREYGSSYKEESAMPGYYSNRLTKYDILTEVSATMRSSIARFTFPGGKANILLNLGEGLTNESGAFVRRVGDNEVEGMKLMGTFCYNAQAVFPLYFVMRVSGRPNDSGVWKKQRPMTVEAEWDKDNGKYKLYRNYRRPIAGDDTGAFFSFDTKKGEVIYVQIGVSAVSIDNARQNLDTEQESVNFDGVRAQAKKSWNDHLSRIMVEGGGDSLKTIFYTALYHTLIHPNILQDVNGEYPSMERGDVKVASGNRYTVFSLWDTYRNLHQLLTLVYPDKQMDMINSMLDMYREHGWLPKWELFGRETLTMEGDPSIPVIVDSWMKGLRGFDEKLAYQAMYKSATMAGTNNLMRPDNDDYISLGYVPLREQFDNSVSHALEYYIADHALSVFASALGMQDDAKLFYNRSMGYKNYYDKQSGTLRPRLPDGTMLTPFNPSTGANFEPSPGFHEGSSWNYTFYVPHDIAGLAKLMGGSGKFVDKLQMVFDKGYYDPANEPDIAYPYLFSYFKGEQWRTQKEVTRLLKRYYTTKTSGLPGNDDTGTMSAWAIFSMMGFYPDCPSDPSYTLTSPAFDRVTIKLDTKYYPESELVIECRRPNSDAIYIDGIMVGDKKYDKYRIDHATLVGAGKIVFSLSDKISNVK